MTTPTVVRDRDNCSVCGLTRRVLKAGVIGQHVVTAMTHGRCAGSKLPPADYAPVVYTVCARGGLTRPRHVSPLDCPEFVEFDVQCSRGDLRGFNEALREVVKGWRHRLTPWLQHQGSLLQGRMTDRPGGYDGPIGASLHYMVTGVRETDIPCGPYVDGPYAGRMRALEPADAIQVAQMGMALGRYEREGESWKWVPAL
jgi:hypothetical protein